MWREGATLEADQAHTVVLRHVQDFGDKVKGWFGFGSLGSNAGARKPSERSVVLGCRPKPASATPAATQPAANGTAGAPAEGTSDPPVSGNVSAPPPTAPSAASNTTEVAFFCTAHILEPPLGAADPTTVITFLPTLRVENLLPFPMDFRVMPVVRRHTSACVSLQQWAIPNSHKRVRTTNQVEDVLCFEGHLAPADTQDMLVPRLPIRSQLPGGDNPAASFSVAGGASNADGSAYGAAESKQSDAAGSDGGGGSDLASPYDIGLGIRILLPAIESLGWSEEPRSRTQTVIGDGAACTSVTLRSPGATSGRLVLRVERGFAGTVPLPTRVITDDGELEAEGFDDAEV